MTGIFITLEGIEGSGKTTQAGRLVEYLRGEGYDVVAIREPGGTEVGEAIRGMLKHDAAGELLVPKAEALLFSASRAQLVRDVILPALERGAVVVCDRFFDSTTAYQGYGRGLDIEELLRMNDFAADGNVPDVTILLDVDVESAFARLADRHAANGTAHDRIEREAADFHGRVRSGYLELAGKWPGRFRVLDSGREQDVVAADIRQVVDAALREKGPGNDRG